MLDYLIKRPMLLSGIGCCIVSVLALHSRAGLTAICFVLPLVIGFLIYFKADGKLLVASVLIFVMGINCILTFHRIDSLLIHSGTKQRAELVITEITYKSDQYYIATSEVMKSDRLENGTKITVFYKPQNINVGYRISADIKLKSVPDDEYKKDNYSKEIYLQGSLSNIKISDGKEDVILTTTQKVRQYIKTTLMDNMGYTEAATLCALIFGERDYFTEDFYSYVKSAGVSHVMVVSGMHMAILVSFIVEILNQLFSNRFLKAFTIILVVAALSLLCGFTMSASRAGVTYILMALGLMLDRKGTPENTLGGALTIILLSSLFAIFSISFQLSLLSTFGILVVAIPFIEKLERQNKLNFITKPIVTSVAFSLSALIFTMPVTVYTFGYISTVSVISNLLISSVVSIALYWAVAGLIANLIIPFLSQYIFVVAGALTKYINFVIEYMGSLPFAVKSVPEYWGHISVLCIFFICLLLVACKKRNDMLKLKRMRDKIIME